MTEKEKRTRQGGGESVRMRNENRQRAAQREKIDRRNTESEERCGKRKRENGKQRPQKKNTPRK